MATYTNMRLTKISLALKRSRSSATMAAHTNPPTMPASSTAGTVNAPNGTGDHKATPEAAIAPSTNWPSAPMFHTLDRKHKAKPKAMMSKGVALIITSDKP